MLVDDTTHETTRATWGAHAAAVLHITRIGEASKPDTIERPIRPDRLLRWLDAHRPAAKAADSAPVEEDTSTADTFANVRYRLKRWPPSSVLRNDARRVRMATLLSKRAFSATELAVVSQQPLAQCHALLRLLRGTGLVKEEFIVPPSQPAFLSADAVPARKPAQRFARGLIGGLRRRLGL